MNTSDYEILNTNAGGQTFREMTAISFCAYVLTKLNGVEKYGPGVPELTLMANSIHGRLLDDDTKLDMLNKLKALSIEIP